MPGQERGFDLDGASAVFGLVVRGKAAEVQGGNSELAKYLNGFVSHHGCEAPWTTIGVSLNKLPGWNRLISRDWPSWVCLLGDVKGAGLWVEDDSELGLAVRWVPGLGYCTGRIVDARARAIRLEGGQAYSVEPWTGGDLWMVRAWVAGETGLDWGRLRDPLLGMGFRFGFPDSLSLASTGIVRDRAELSKGIGDEGSDPYGATTLMAPQNGKALDGKLIFHMSCSAWSSWKDGLPCKRRPHIGAAA